ncbi:MAG TPA: nuclear transport factor 2 family protein [Bacillota bacterium]|nr:nuclear transport factor 2 family protein [Bacillota bacterium]
MHNKDRATQFLALASSGSVDEAYERFVLAGGRHHSPYFAAGFAALKTGMKENHRQFPDKRLTILRVLADGDLVAVHAHMVLRPGDPGVAVLHLFRFEGEKIAELWDFSQPVKPDSPNTDGLF